MSCSTEDAPIVALDIDGTLGDYHSHFLWFAEQWTGKAMPAADDINPALPLHRHMRLSKATYRACKLAYRQGGLKRFMPCDPGARDLTVALRRAGARVWICTTRPYLRLDNIDPDTRHWLRRNGIQYDNVLFGHLKYRDLVRSVGKERVVGVLDDLDSMCEQAQVLGLPVLMRDRPYNQHMQEIPRVRNLAAAEMQFVLKLDRWKRARAK